MASSLAASCSPSTFDPAVFGARILSVEANLVTNYSDFIPETFRFVDPSVQLENVSFCNVTVEYTHPGQDDNIFVETWLPADDWNGRLQAVGGGGWAAGRFELPYYMMKGALADGFATTTSDAGLGDAQQVSPWALLSPGNVNLHKFRNFGSVALNDQAVITKSLVNSFYGRGPEYSYFNGCSQGGRQALTLAQRYPDAYDGISAGAPAVDLPVLGPYLVWPQQVMNELGEYPHNCELDAIHAAAISACDGLDGVEDGVISKVDECLAKFDPFSVVGDTFKCRQTNGTDIRVSEAAAKVVNATWHGMPIKNGKGVYQGVPPGADLTGNQPGSQGGIATTNCTESGCTGAPTYLGVNWLQYFVAKDPEFDFNSLSRDQWNDLVHQGGQQYSSVIGTSDPDLTRFRDAGGKMITFHGLADLLIPPKSVENYYQAVSEFTGDIHDFYRFFEVPGLGHCAGRTSGQPNQLMRQLRDWVENGTAPNTSPVKLNSTDGTVHDRILCPFPQTAQFDKSCGDASSADCWACEGSLPSP